MKKNYCTKIIFLTVMFYTLFSGKVISNYNENEENNKIRVSSPSGNIDAFVHFGNELKYSVDLDSKEIIMPSPISMKFDNGIITGEQAKLKNKNIISVSEKIYPVVKQKFNTIQDNYNQLEIDFTRPYRLIFRVYDDGVAYRWIYTGKKPCKVLSEEAGFNFGKDFKIWFPEEESMLSHQERMYKYIRLSEIKEDRFCSTGTLIDLEENIKVYISEADLESYPGMFLKGSENSNYSLKGLFVGYPLETKQESDRTVKVTKHADFIAKVNGPREFPWRVMVITTDDSQLLTTEMIYKLSNPLQLKDASWIKPGKVAWDWWNANNIYGVDFRAGINTETYKYYIDFASAYGIEYIILDEGWYHLEDVLKVKKEIDVQELIRYGNEKNVGIILWVTWKALDDKLDEVLDTFQKWGTKGIKVDFMQRDDQWMVEYYHKVAREAAKRKLLVDYHGAYKPTGLRRAYPNVITREGVQGLEHCKWSANTEPEHNLTLPFIRMVAGPMDYTPGAMLNANKRNFRDIFTEPMSLGTRCHQLAMYVIYESPLQMLADNPSNYYREPECMKFLSVVPTVWDDTKVLEAKVGDYIVNARRSGDTWFVGAMTDWDARSFEINLDFLDQGDYVMEIWQDGVNADRHAADYIYRKLDVTNASKIKINLAPGGGWVGVIWKI